MKKMLKTSALLLAAGLMVACSQVTGKTRTEVYQQDVDGATLVFTFKVDEASDQIKEQEIQLTLPYQVAGFESAEAAKAAIQLPEVERKDLPDGAVIHQDFQADKVVNTIRMDYSKLDKEDIELAFEKYSDQDITLADEAVDMSDLKPYLDDFKQVS